MTAKTFGPMWLPLTPELSDSSSNFPSAVDTMLLDADEEEAQFIGQVFLAAGSGSKTFGNSGSKIDWNSGASITFGVVSTLRVGVKKNSSISTANGPPARATVGAAAFDVYKDLVAGVDTIGSTAWFSTAMASGTPFTVSHGDLLAVCFHLDITSGSQSVKIRQQAGVVTNGFNFPQATLVTTGGTVFTAIVSRANFVLTFDDGTLGWFLGAMVAFNTSAAETIGNGNIYGLQFRPTVPITVGAVAAQLTPAGTTNYDVGIWLASDPSAPLASVSADPQQQLASNRRNDLYIISALNLSAGTDYVVGVKQNSATGIDIINWDQNDTAFHVVNGLDANAFAVKSSGGGAFTSQNSGKRRPAMWFQATMFSDGTDGGGAPLPGIIQAGVGRAANY